MSIPTKTNFTKQEVLNIENKLNKRIHWLENYVKNLCQKLKEYGDEPIAYEPCPISLDYLPNAEKFFSTISEPIWEGVVVEYPNKMCLFDSNLYKLLVCKCQKCTFEMNLYGYRKMMIVGIVSNYLREVEKVFSKEEKKKVVERMFRVLCHNQCKKFMDGNKTFKETVRNKLNEIYYKDREYLAYIYYRRIFGERIGKKNL